VERVEFLLVIPSAAVDVAARWARHGRPTNRRSVRAVELYAPYADAHVWEIFVRPKDFCWEISLQFAHAHFSLCVVLCCLYVGHCYWA